MVNINIIIGLILANYFYKVCARFDSFWRTEGGDSQMVSEMFYCFIHAFFQEL